MALIASACRWESTVHLATSLQSVGFDIGFLAPAGHPVGASIFSRSRVMLSFFRPSHSLNAAIESLEPDIVIPTDEVMVVLLHQLYRDDPTKRALIQRSLGTPVSFGMILSRVGLADVARAEDIDLPPTGRITSERDLNNWISRHGLPAFLKIDGTWGGAGVIRIETASESARAFRRLHGFLRLPRALGRAALHRDATRLSLRRANLEISIQSEVAGVPANCAVTAWGGELLACIAVAALTTRAPTGASTVVRVLHNHPMRDICRRIVRRLGLSGLVGFDFVLEKATGRAILIELNARATQTTYLRLGDGADPAEALRASVTRQPVRAAPPMFDCDVIELFSQPPMKEPSPIPD